MSKHPDWDRDREDSFQIPPELSEHETDRALHILQERSQPTTTRLDAIHFIIDQFESKFFPVLESLLNDENEDPDVRSAAALALGKIGGDMALKLLMAHVNSTDITVKNYTVQALGLLGREEGIPVLIESLGDTNNRIFASAAEALGEIGKPAVPHLMQLLPLNSAVRDDARCVAAWQLGQLKYTEAVPALISTIRENQNPEVVALCIWALGEIGHFSTEVTDVLNWASTQENPALHERAKMARHKITRYLN